MRPDRSGCCSSHRPTANTVIGRASRRVASSMAAVRAGSPEPWKVRATAVPVRGPWSTKAAGPPWAATLVDGAGDEVDAVDEVDEVGGAERWARARAWRAAWEQAASPRAAAPPSRTVRREG